MTVNEESRDIEAWSRSQAFLRQLSDLDSRIAEAHYEQSNEKMVRLLRTKALHLAAFIGEEDYERLLRELTELSQRAGYVDRQRTRSKGLLGSKELYARSMKDIFFECERVAAKLSRVTKDLGFDFKLRHTPRESLYE